MKRKYQKPTAEVYEMKIQSPLLLESKIPFDPNNPVNPD